MSEFHVLIDDMKSLPGMDTVVRTYDEGVQILSEGKITHLYIDHDLGEERSGYNLIVWAIENEVLPPNIQIVSMNPVGRNNIERALVSEGYTKVGSYWVDR